MLLLLRTSIVVDREDLLMIPLLGSVLGGLSCLAVTLGISTLLPIGYDGEGFGFSGLGTPSLGVERFGVWSPKP